LRATAPAAPRITQARPERQLADVELSDGRLRRGSRDPHDYVVQRRPASDARLRTVTVGEASTDGRVARGIQAELVTVAGGVPDVPRNSTLIPGESVCMVIACTMRADGRWMISPTPALPAELGSS
jgi:hypothetical protein